MEITFPSINPSMDDRLSRIEAAIPRSIAGGLLYSSSAYSTPSSSAVLPSGLISPSKGISATGSTFPFVVKGNFNFSWSSNILTIYWDGTNGSASFVIRRSDNTCITIPDGQMAIAGLSASTKYAFASYIAVAQPNVVSFVAGDSGSPRFAFSPSASADTLSAASQTQRLTVNESLTDGLIYFTTGTSTTTTTGSGSGSTSSPYTNQPDDPTAARTY